jgi:hypothetical protein
MPTVLPQERCPRGSARSPGNQNNDFRNIDQGNTAIMLILFYVTARRIIWE